MARKTVINHSQNSQQDIRDSALYLLDEAGEEIALRFLAEIDESIDLLLSHPELGALVEADLPGNALPIRHKVLDSFGYLIYYTLDETPALVTINVIRVLHSKQDRWNILSDE